MHLSLPESVGATTKEQTHWSLPQQLSHMSARCPEATWPPELVVLSYNFKSEDTLLGLELDRTMALGFGQLWQLTECIGSVQCFAAATIHHTKSRRWKEPPGQHLTLAHAIQLYKALQLLPRWALALPSPRRFPAPCSPPEHSLLQWEHLQMNLMRLLCQQVVLCTLLPSVPVCYTVFSESFSSVLQFLLWSFSDPWIPLRTVWTVSILRFHVAAHSTIPLRPQLRLPQWTYQGRQGHQEWPDTQTETLPHPWSHCRPRSMWSPRTSGTSSAW